MQSPLPMRPWTALSDKLPIRRSVPAADFGVLPIFRLWCESAYRSEIRFA